MQDYSTSLSLPVIAAPMFLVSGVDLVVNCCKNGVIGSFPSLNARSSEDFESMLNSIQNQLEEYERSTGKKAAPFAVNLIVHKSNIRLQDDLKACIRHRVPIIITSLGAVKEVIDAVHGYGGLVYHDIIKKRHAEKAAEQGVDGLILVCNGAGGHAGVAHPFALIHEVRSFFKKTIILSGTISTGEDILAAQTIGADYAYMGTRFIATRESMAGEEYKNMVVDSGISDILYSDKISGVNANFLKKSIENAGLDLKAIEVPDEDFSSLKDNDKKAWKDIWSAGQGVAAIHDVLSVEELVKRLKNEYLAAYENIRRMSSYYR